MLKRLHQRLIQPILAAHDSPEAVAGGVAIGLGLALTPTVGIQMPLAWLLATLCGANRVVALAMVWVSNPLTVVPMYYLEYLLGSSLLARESVTSYQDFQALWAAMADLGYLERIRTLSDALLLPLVVGSGGPAVLVGAVSYPISLWWVRLRRRRREALPAAAQDAAAEDVAAGDADPGPIVAGEPGAPVEPLPEDPLGDSTTLRVGALVLLGLLPVLGGCMDRARSGGEVAVPEMVTLEHQECTLWVGSLEQGLVAVVGPLHPAETQSRFTQDRLQEALGEAAAPVTFLSLQVHRLAGAEGALSFGAGPAQLEVETATGRSRSLPPSELLTAAAGTRQRALLAALLGGDVLPDLGPGQALRLVLTLPAGTGWQEAQRVELRLGERAVPLRRRVLPAAEWDLLLQHPTADAWQTLLQAPDE